MSTIKMQESTYNEEVTQLRKQAASKDNCYATLENEFLKKNNDFLAVKKMLDETLSKLRQEADRALKLESDLNRQTEDLRSERLNRHNLEASLKAANEKLASEEQSAKYIQMELDTYASRMSSQHEQEVKRLQHEKSTLESRVRVLESQSSQANAHKPSQAPTRLPRPTTFSGAASTVLEARIATLESDLSKARLELADASRSLTAAQQDAAKVPRLQSDLIVADNARLRAEKAANAERADAENTRELLKEREEELEYWRSTAAERSVDEGRLEDALRERDEAVRSEGEARRRENVLRTRIQELEEAEAGLVMQCEEALSELHRLQVESPDSRSGDSTITELRSALSERESALLNSQGHALELQQMYRDTLSACKDAEARVRDLELQLHPSKHDLPPLVIVSPPPSPSTTPTPFLAQPKPMTRMSREDEAIVVRLLTAIERLRGERDALRRDLHFAEVEHRMTDDALRARLDAAEREVCRLEKVVAASQVSTDQQLSGGKDELRRLHEELETWRDRFQRTDEELSDRTSALARNATEMDSMRVRVREVEESRQRLIASYKDTSRIAVSSLIAIQHLGSELDHSENRLTELYQTSDEASVADQTLRAELVAVNARYADAAKDIEERDSQITAMHSKLSEFQDHVTSLECEIIETREELNAAEIRYQTQRFSGLASQDGGDGAKAMESQLEVLEQRVLRRTEQIGMLQHDIKRLETNLRLAEETIGELTAELETLKQDRACLVDDCAQAREARDDALRRVEELEVEVESFTSHYDALEETKVALQTAKADVVTCIASLETMVHMYAESVTRSRGLHTALTRTRARLGTAEANATLADDRHSRALTEIKHLSSEIDSMALTVRRKTGDMDTLTRELASANEEVQRLTIALDCLRDEAQSREEDVTGETQQLTATVNDLQGQLAAAQSSREALSQELETAQVKKRDLQAMLERAQGESRQAVKETQRLSAAVASLEQELRQERTSHSEAITLARDDFEREASALKAQVEKSRKQYLSLQAEHAHVTQDFKRELEEAKAQLAKACEAAASRKSLELDIHRLNSEHANELAVLRSQLDESSGQADSLRAQIKTATETIKALESEAEMSSARYDAAQVEVRGLEQALVAARTHVAEHDASIQGLHREKTTLQIEQTRLEAELDRLVTKHQYAEQQAKRSDHEVMRLKPEVERLRGEVAKLDEAAQAAEINLSLKTNQYEQKLAMMQRELVKQQSHSQCQETIAGLNEKIEYIESMLKMRLAEIEENDDRFIDALKEKKRLTNRVDSLTRKVQSLQTKVAALTAAPPSASSPPLPLQRPKTPSPPVPSVPSAGPSSHAPTRVPSSPGVALRSKTPEPLRNTFVSRIGTPEPLVPPLPNTTYKTPDQSRPASRVDIHRPTEAPYSFSCMQSTSPAPSGGKKRRAPDDFDSPTPGPAEAIMPLIDNTTPRLRRPMNDSRNGFTPKRNNTAVSQRLPMVPPLSPLKRSVAPLAETTNSPRGNRPIGLGKPTSVSKPPARSWLSRTRGVSNASTATRSTSVLGMRP